MRSLPNFGLLTRFERERRYLIGEMSQVKGLMPLLMRRRNGAPWTPHERAELREHLRRLSHLSPYLVALVMPGGFALLPALAWWLDRRRGRLAMVPLDRRGTPAHGRVQHGHGVHGPHGRHERPNRHNSQS